MTALLVTAGVAAVTVTPAAAQGQAACLPALNQTLGTGDFTASTSGSGVGNLSVETATGPGSEGTGRVSWAVREAVTGNTGGGAGAMTGDLSLVFKQGKFSIAFVSSCILEVGVFSGSTEDDPFDPEINRTVIRGVEGEWIGTAYNYPTAGKSTQVVASIAVWTTSAGPRFHLDITTATFAPGVCPDEGTFDSNPSISAAGPTQPNSSVSVVAPLSQESGLGACAI
jgi:hypothetical protein